MLNHFRHAPRRYSLELPRGFAEPTLSFNDNMNKELFEETGLSPKTSTYIGCICADTGMLGTLIDVIVCECSSENNLQVIDQEEAISGIKLLSKDELKLHMQTGELFDGITLSALMCFQYFKK